MENYNPKDIEPKWQKKWEEEKTYSVSTDFDPKEKFYILPQLPYPSGSGLHVGHAEVYAACDIYARFQRMMGKDVLQVFGLDSFGLPAENYAIKTGVHPAKTIDETGANFVDQVKKLGASVDWDRFVRTSDPGYYKFTQWFFLFMYERGLAYRKKQLVNWCDGCKTVLANEQVVDGKCERSDDVVVQKEMEQWYLKITEYADRLLDDLDKIDWPEETKRRQRNWIGRSEGAEVDFGIVGSEQKITVFTTRPDTIFGATYMVLAPEHKLIQELKDQISNWNDIAKYIDATSKKTELERQVDQEKTGVELQGIKAVNPVSGEEIPVWIADYVLASYGTGAIMAVPAHDERDFAFAKTFGLPMKEVVAPHIVLTGDCAPKEEKELSQRDVVTAIIKNTSNDTYLLLEWPNGDYGFVGGGKDLNESFKEAIIREVEEETGYKNITIVRELIPSLYGHGYKPRKDVNCFDLDKIFLIEVDDSNQAQEHEGNTEEHNLHWLDKDSVKNKLTLDHHQFVWEWYVENKRCFSENGISINSDFLNGLSTEDSKEKIIAHLEEKGIGKRKVQYKLRDWSVSRQRFWGAPVPMLYDEKGELHPVPVADLPVKLPSDVDFKPTGQSPLTYSEEFQAGVEEKYGKGWKREVDTLDTFMCSSWYFFRYLDPNNENEFASPEELKRWMPVDFYLGGEEHVNGHLLYSRFFTKVLFDAGYIDFDEPFKVNRHQGLILGPDSRKMSKRWGNVVNPNDVVAEYGADTLRIYEMFMGPLEQTKPWNDNGVKGVRRFLERVWNMYETTFSRWSELKDGTNIEADTKLYTLIKDVKDDLSNLKFNTAVAKMMEYVNYVYKENGATLNQEHAGKFIKILSPFAPHIAEEIWQKLGNDTLISDEKWPEIDESKIVKFEQTIVVQVNGKVRAKLTVDPNIGKGEIEAMALEQENVQKFLQGKEPKKVIYVPGKLVSVVV